MVKLIRLATNNDGIFKSSFGNSIDIKPNGKIALLNLTFRTDLVILNIDSSNNQITFASDIANQLSVQTVTLPTKSYTSLNIRDLITDLVFTLNETLQLNNAIGNAGAASYNGVSSAFTGYLQDDLVHIVYRYAPMVNPFNKTSSQNEFPSKLLMGYRDVIMDIVATNNTTVIQKIGSEPSTATRDNNALMNPAYVFSKGSGMYYARIADFVTNLSGLNDNGAGIGLSDKGFFLVNEGPIPGENITLDRCTFEVSFNRVTENYKYIVNGDSIERDSGILPSVVSTATSASVALHDVMFIEKNGPYIQVGVYQDFNGQATRQVFGTGTDLAVKGKNYSPYLYLRGKAQNIKLDMVNISINPFNFNTQEQSFWNWDVLGATDLSALRNSWSDMLASDNPSPGYIMPKFQQDRWVESYPTDTNLDSNLWKTLGFDQALGQSGYVSVVQQLDSTIGTDQNPFSLILDAENVTEIIGSDNFIVISDTLPLDSYDASKVFYTPQNTNADYFNTPFHSKETERLGRRQNILMTIPENNNTDGLVEFQTNTPIFIDINNTETLNVRNLNFRILNKDFSQINTLEEQAIMTILLD